MKKTIMYRWVLTKVDAQHLVLRKSLVGGDAQSMGALAVYPQQRYIVIEAALAVAKEAGMELLIEHGMTGILMLANSGVPSQMKPTSAKGRRPRRSGVLTRRLSPRVEP